MRHLFSFHPLTAQTLLSGITLLALSALGFAWVAEHVLGFHPCILCLYERWPYRAALVLGSSGLLICFRFPRLTPVFFWMLAVTFLGGFFLSAYHVGVEAHIFPPPPACVPPQTHYMCMEELKQQILAQPFVRCDRVAWTFLGISMTLWNMLASLFLTSVSVWGACRRR